VPNEFVIGYVLLTLLIKRLAVAMVNKTVGCIYGIQLCPDVLGTVYLTDRGI
jgi:hypothetical protein